MKQILIEGKEKVSIVDAEKPTLRPDEVMIKIGFVGFCGSDLNTWLGQNALAISPVVPGHEIGGTVEEIGAEVPEGLFHKGMHVTVNPYTACGKCPSCRQRRPNTCRDNQTLGVQRHGAMQEYIAVPWEKVVEADGLSVKECALIEPMSVGFHAVSRGGVTDIDTVMVIGCGMIGLGPSGDGRYDVENADVWLDLCDKNNVSYACWAISNSYESAAYFQENLPKYDGNWTEDDLTTTSKYIINRYNDRKAELEASQPTVETSGEEISRADDNISTPAEKTSKSPMVPTVIAAVVIALGAGTVIIVKNRKK